jgi:hypothetical protein
LRFTTILRYEVYYSEYKLAVGTMGKRGRPPKGEHRELSAVLTMRIRADTRAALERIARKNGLSLGQQAERLLRGALDEPKEIEKRFGSERAYAIWRALAEAVKNTSAYCAKHRGGIRDDGNYWLNDAWAFDQSFRAIGKMLAAFAPAGDPKPPSRKTGQADRQVEGALLGTVGGGIANAMLRAIREPDANGDYLQRLGFRIRRDLGGSAPRVDLAFQRKFTKPDGGS